MMTDAWSLAHAWLRSSSVRWIAGFACLELVALTPLVALAQPSGGLQDLGTLGGNKSVAEGLSSGITASFAEPETTINPHDLPEVEVITEPGSPLGVPLHADIVIRNMDAEPRDYTCYVHVRAMAQNGKQIGVVVGPRTDPLTIAAGGEVIVPADAAWAMVQPWIGSTEFFEFFVVVTRVHDERLWFKKGFVVIRGLPVAVALAPADRVGLGNQVVATVTYSNPLPTPLTGATLRLSGDSELLINGTAREEEIALGAIPPGASGTVVRTLTAARVGSGTFSARLYASDVMPGEDFESVTVVQCPANFQQDGTVQPATTCLSGTASFSVAVGPATSGPFTYQWRKGTTPISTVANPSAGTANLVLSNVQPTDGDVYDCIVANACGAMISNGAILTVLAPTNPKCNRCGYDFNQDETVDLTDAQLMTQVLIGLLTPESNWLDGDLNGDENADLTDAQILAAYVVTGNCGV
jgi:hypothetical protein